VDLVLALQLIDKETIRKRRFRVVVDCVDAAGGAIVPPLLRTLGCDVVEMACDVRGIFSHTPEPIPENLTGLAGRVQSEHADLGIAVDPDVDRLVLINEKGEPYGRSIRLPRSSTSSCGIPVGQTRSSLQISPPPALSMTSPAGTVPAHCAHRSAKSMWPG
jgi:phosphomannomutase